MNLRKTKSALIVIVMLILYRENPLTSAVNFVTSSSEVDEYYPEERDALLKLRDSVSSNSNLHGNWSGPPCINNSSRWAGIACSNGHVVHIALQGIQLAGSLPPAFLHNITLLSKLTLSNNTLSGPLPNLSNLVYLEDVLLSYNYFWGSIPLEYTELPNLRVLELQDNFLDGKIPPFGQPTLRGFNVSYNHLVGPIPQTGVLQKFPISSYSHNSNLCGIPLETPCPLVPPPSPSPAIIAPSPSSNIIPPKNKNNLQVWSVALIATAAALVPFIVIFVFLCYYGKMQTKEAAKEEQAGDGSSGWVEKKMPHLERLGDPEKRVELDFFDKEMPAAFDLDDLLRASAQVLGNGKLGSTYKVALESGLVVIVKRLKNMNELSKKEFTQQMQLLGNMRHENLVRILSFYFSKEEKLVISKFVSGGRTLFQLLHEDRGVGRVALDWATRLSIIKDIAQGLTFLHQSLPSQKVPHANLNSSNVLVIQRRNSQIYDLKLTDFGFLPLLPSRKSSEDLAISKSPEFAQGKKLSQKADVYCFGIILLEVVTGRIPGEVSPGNDEIFDDLSDWVRMVVNNDWSTDILDVEILAAKDDHDDMLKLTQIALDCTDMTPEKRPKMVQVLKRIQEINSLKIQEMTYRE
ncbi:hypothetical protein FF2_015766 [Malus domestica]